MEQVELQYAILDQVRTRTNYRLLTTSGGPGMTERLVTHVNMRWDEWVDLVSRSGILDD